MEIYHEDDSLIDDSELQVGTHKTKTNPFKISIKLLLRHELLHG
jgi:hypothetical protein